MIDALRVFVLAATLSGCSSLGNALIPPHQNSDFRDPDLTCLTFKYSDAREEFGEELLAQGAGAVIGWTIDQAAKVIEKEGGRYKATFSGRDSTELYHISQDGMKIRQKLLEVRLTRYHGQEFVNGCQADIPADLKAFDFSADISINEGKNAIELRPKELVIYKTKAKVPGLSLWPHTWWRILDGNTGKVDYSARIVMVAVSESQAGVNQEELMKVDVPLGRYTLAKDPRTVKLSGVSSGWAPLPRVKRGAAKAVSGLPISITISITEANFLGDVLADASTKVSDSKDRITNKIVKLLNLEK
jgi:hypothetical protein